MILLPNGCYCSELKVLPKNWKTAKASLKETWQVYYRFYDPRFKTDQKYAKGKLIRLKGMNGFKTLEERQVQTQQIIDTELLKLRDEGYNAITGYYATGMETAAVRASTPFLKALTDVEKSITACKTTKSDLKYVLKFVEKAAAQLGLIDIPVTQISRKHVKMLLNQIEINQGGESAHRYNKNCSYLMILFKELVEMEAIETNPVREISKKQRLQPVRELLSTEERKKIDEHLKINNYRFWLFTHIFYHSGARITEIMHVRRRDVDLVNQTFKVIVKKGKLFKQVIKPIKDASLLYWQESINDARPDDYLFSAGLQAGQTPINTDQITKRWKLHVKKKLGIEADFYSLKHLHLDEISAALSIEDAAAMASHTSSTITLKHYAVGEKQRQNDRLKALNNVFA